MYRNHAGAMSCAALLALAAVAFAAPPVVGRWDVAGVEVIEVTQFGSTATGEAPFLDDFRFKKNGKFRSTNLKGKWKQKQNGTFVADCTPIAVQTLAQGGANVKMKFFGLKRVSVPDPALLTGDVAGKARIKIDGAKLIVKWSGEFSGDALP